MILENKKQEEVYTLGLEGSTKMSLDEENISFIIRMISKFYSDGIGSTIREWTSNAWDASIEIEDASPIKVRLYSENGGWKFSVRDFGVGIDQELVDNVISKYGKSTKRNSNKQLGAWGLNLVP